MSWNVTKCHQMSRFVIKCHHVKLKHQSIWVCRVSVPWFFCSQDFGSFWLSENGCRQCSQAARESHISYPINAWLPNQKGKFLLCICIINYRPLQCRSSCLESRAIKRLTCTFSYILSPFPIRKGLWGRSPKKLSKCFQIVHSRTVFIKARIGK